ncbi:MAG: hypothetical protein GC179_14790 [Anaerolineaceae bacterium]|nr:hypothetical protein [Anaerolineaceae bacterium]
MNKPRRLAVVLLIAGISFVLSGLSMAVVFGQDNAGNDAAASTQGFVVAGTIMTDDGPVAGAIVQVQATDNKTQTAEDGTFSLNGLKDLTSVVLTAWAPGHYIGWTKLDPTSPDWKGSNHITIMLKALPQSDYSKYEWYSFDGTDGSAACGLCHREYTEWQADRHSMAATNDRFLDVYMGTDINGESGQQTNFDVDGKPLPPDSSQPFHGPGFRLDNPSRGGNCATCHTPTASNVSNDQNCTWSGCHTGLTIERSNGLLQYSAIPSKNLKGDAAEGISCEFCHKTVNVIIDPKTGMPFPDMPGILSMELRRPRDDSQQVFFGTLVDVARADSYLPLLSESQFCAGCHFGVFGGVVGMQRVKDGTVVYNSYGEWLTSPYSDPKTGKTCQQCHMSVSADNWFVFPEKGGLTRDGVQLHDHTMLGPSDGNMLQNTVTMTTDAQHVGNQIRVKVSITNDRAGHDVPTDVPMRSVILVVEALDAKGNLLTLADGSVNPAYSGDYAGLPGKTFAKILRDELTGEAPTIAFWRPVTIVEDNRIKAMATDTSNYVFALRTNEAVTVNVKLIYRWAFYELMQQKGWNDPDILMEHATVQLPAN